MDRPEYFRSDGAHLSERALDVFRKDIKEGLLWELGELDVGHGT